MGSLYLRSHFQEVNNNLSNLFSSSLYNKEEEGSVEALTYLYDRGISDDLIDKFKIGWYPPNRFVPNKSPFLSGRIIFPIIDEYGDVRAFSGRKMDFKKGDEQPKYFHESYPKSFFLYGMNLAWRHILHSNRVILTEGQTDVIAAHKAGLRNTVGIMGSSLKFESFVKLNRFCDRYILMFDQDEAGIKCSNQAKQMLEKYGKECIVVKLKTKEDDFDADSFSQRYGSRGLVKAVLHYIKKNKVKKDG